MPTYLKQKNLEEIVVVNDASTDCTESYILELGRRVHHPKIRYVKHNVRKGTPAARNTGLNVSSCKYVLFGEDDVAFSNDYSLVLQKTMEKSNVEIVGGKMLSIKKGETFEECVNRYRRSKRTRINLINKQLFLGNFSLDTIDTVPFLHACALFKREVFDSLRYDENYRYNYYREETDLFLSAKMKGFKILYTKDAVCFHLPHAMNGLEGAHFLNGNSIVVKLLTTIRCFLLAYSNALPVRVLFYVISLDYDLMKIVNNNYFLDKYFDFLSREFNCTHNKAFYKLTFALNLIREKMRPMFRFGD